MRKQICIFFISILLLVGLLTSCGSYVSRSVHGFEMCTPNLSERGINKYLLPSEEFIDAYSYIYGDYYYYQYNDFSGTGSYEISIAYLGYTNEDYPKAKQLCLDTMNISETNIHAYKSFIFFENMSLPEGGTITTNANSGYPYRFNMFGYSDSKNQLMFLGFYGESEDLETMEFDVLVKKYFGKYYKFDRGVYDSTTESSTQ